MNPHTHKWAHILGVGVPMDSRIFKEQLQGSKPIGLKSFLYHWKSLGTQMSKMGSHDPFGHLKHKLWPKERSIIKLAIWLPTTKSQESPWFPCVQVACDIPLRWKVLNEGYNFALDLISIISLRTKLWAFKVTGFPTLGISRLSLGSPGTKWHLGAGPVAMHIIYYKGEGGDFPQVRAMVSLVSPCLFVARPCTKVLQLHTNQLVV